VLTDPKGFVSTTAPTDSLFEAIYTQRAIRYWEDRQVPREMLEEVVQAGSKAPSGSNTQPWMFVVVDDAAQRSAIAAAMREMFESTGALQNMIEEGENSELKERRLRSTGARAFFSKLELAPVLIVPCLYRLSSPTRDPNSLEAGSSIYLAVQNMLLAARALGLGTLMTTAHRLIETELRSILDIPADAHPVALVPLGFAGAKFGPTRRKNVNDILCWNRWSV